MKKAPKKQSKVTNLLAAQSYIEVLKAKVQFLDSKLIEAKQESQDEELLRTRLAKILSDTAIALHGGKLKHGLWSWHDLAELADRQRQALDAAFHALRSYQFGNAATDLAGEVADACDKVLNERKEDTYQEHSKNERRTNGKTGRGTAKTDRRSVLAGARL